jgi:hypothetical protein
MNKLPVRVQLLTSIGFGLLAMPSFGQGPGWTAVSTVVQVVNTSNGGVNVRLSPDLTGCTSQSGYGGSYASIYPNHPGINRIKADLLVALTSEIKVSLYLNDSTCTVTEMRLGGL